MTSICISVTCAVFLIDWSYHFVSSIQRPCQQWMVFFLYLLLDHYKPQNFLLIIPFSRLRLRANGGCDRSAKDANSDSTYSTSNYLCRSFCLFCFYFLVSTQYFFLIDNHWRFLLQKKIAYDLRMTRSWASVSCASPG